MHPEIQMAGAEHPSNDPNWGSLRKEKQLNTIHYYTWFYLWNMFHRSEKSSAHSIVGSKGAMAVACQLT
jgi:hypothetical protein